MLALWSKPELATQRRRKCLSVWNPATMVT